MVGPKEYSVRPPAVAGAFYPADPEQCSRVADTLVSTGGFAAGAHVGGWGGIVPHAGWVCSGAIAGATLAALAVGPAVDLVVIFGAVHTPGPLDRAVFSAHDAWEVPGATLAAETEEARKLCDRGSLFGVDERFHLREHAIEVELPLIGRLWPAARILPIEVPPSKRATAVGRRTAAQVLRRGGRVLFLASSDLTHYGPAYGFTPAGVGAEGLDWAKDNDRRLLQLVVDLAADRVVPEARSRHNACGGGAIAAMLAACLEAGASGARVLRHQNSYETLAGVIEQEPTDAVGYAAVVVA